MGNLTVGALKKAIRALPDNMPVYIADHDHSTYETNSIARKAEVVDQSKAPEYLKPEDEFKIDGKYFVIRP